jgi:hypothetical protein
MIPNPWMILGVIFVAVSVYFYGHHKGWAERDAEMQAEIAVKNEESRAKEQEMTTKLNEQSTKLQEANNVLGEKQTALDRAIRAGRVRLPTSSCVQTPSNPTTPSGNSVQETSESDRETLAAIAALVAEGDRAINQLNACIDSYNQVRETTNGQR